MKELQKQKIYNYKNTLYALVKMVEDRDTYTGGHSLRVAKYSKLIAQNLNLDEETCENIYEAGILHDIGKIAIPDNVLLKPGSLNDLEYTLIQEHVNLGVKMLSKVPMFKELAKFIDGHHERLDGSGYPKGLKGEQIALESQIMAISDAFDAMTTSRIYKARKSIPEALNELESLSGKHYSEDVTKSAIAVLKDIIIDNNISQLPTTQIEKERFSYFYKDQTTQSYNSNYLDLVLRQNSYDEKYKYLYIISIHNLNQVNITYGWEQGSEFLKDFYQKLKNIFSEYNIFRVFSDDFIILSDVELNIDREVIQSCISKKEISFDIQTYDIVKEKIDSIQSIDILQ
ncbi:MAG: HD domain-containing protein [Arcobacteraceae bacterium]|nr:HD domain-containing protein [Arcobacteraceae bacterium]